MKHKTSTRLFSIQALAFVFVFSISIALSASENEEVQPKDLKQAFQALKKSMKQATQTEAKPNDPLDAALDQAFNPLPDEVLNSDVDLDRVDTSESKKAWKEISDIAINDDIEIEYRQKGKALSLLLWSGSRKELQSVLSNILKQLYSDKDSRSYRFIVNSSPIPYIEATSVDLNLEKRIAADQIYERDMDMASKMVSLTGIPRVPKKEEVPVKMGVEIKLSAGMLATFKNVDEMAGQLAKVLATLNPGVYGVQEDTSFTRNQKYFELINQIVDGGTDDAHVEARKKRAAVIAELSAIERLAAGGFNPWALYYYEERVFSWMADVFLESPNHGLGRFLVESDLWKVKDWSRPLRMQLQSYYIAYLQSKERGAKMRLIDTSWSGTMKYIRLRMKLYTKPYFSGLIYQLGVTGSIAAGYLFFPEISHWALTAWHLTSSENGVAKEIIQNPETIGQIAKQGHAISKDILDYSYLSAKASELSASTLAAIEALDGHYGKIIAAGGAIISAGMIAKYRAYIAEFFNSFVPKLDELPEESEAAKKAQSAAEKENLKKQNGSLESSASSDLPEGSELSDVNSDRAAAESSVQDSKDKIIVSLAGTAVTIHTRLLGLGQYLINKRNAAISAYTKTQQRVSGTGVVLSRIWGATKSTSIETAKKSQQAFVVWAQSSKEAVGRKATATKEKSLAVGRALERFAKAGLDLSIRSSKTAVNASVSGSVSAWQNLVRVSQAAPEVITDRATRSTRFVVGVGGKILRGTGKALAVSVKYSALGVYEINRFVFITAPVELTQGGVRLVVSQLEKSKERKEQAEIRKQDRLRQQELINNEAQAGQDKLNSVLLDSRVTPREVYNYFIDLDRVHRTGSAEARKLGLDDGKKMPDLALVLLEKWLKQTKVHKVVWDEAYAMYELFGRYYHWMPVEKRMNPKVLELGFQLMELLIERSSYHRMAELARSEGQRNLQFLPDMLFNYDAVKLKVHDASAEVSLEAVVRVIGKISSSDPQLNRAFELYQLHIDKIFVAATNGSVSNEELRAFITAVYLLSNKERAPKLSKYKARNEFAHLSAIRRARIIAVAPQHRNLWSTSTFWGRDKSKGESHSAFSDQASYWVDKATSITDLTTMIEKDCAEFNLDPELFRDHLLTYVLKRLDLVHSYQEFEKLFEKEYFWSNQVEDIQSTPLERPLVALLKMKRGQYGDSPAWKYDPIVSERIHSAIRERLLQLKQYPKSFEEIENFWKTLTSRGVSTFTDDLLGQLLRRGNEEQIKNLENYAVREGRVFDQGLRDEFAIRQIRKSQAYSALMAVADSRGQDRGTQIHAFLEQAQSLMSDLGIRYVELLEEVSNRIHSSYEEAALIHEYKAKSLVRTIKNSANAVNDSRLQMLHEILPYIKKWSGKNQYEFLLYLRGSIEATDFIKAQFPKFGPERIRKIYQGLPLESATAVVNLYLQETILARKEVNEGYGKKMINYLVKGGTDSETQKYAGLLLEGLLVGIDRANNKPFQKQVLSALIAMKPNETASVGETMKLILEQFPGVGPKIGQFLVATGLLSEDINLVLRKTQDQTLPPKRFDIYNDLSLIVGNNQNIGVEIVDLLGSGSLKYSMKGREIQNGTELALQVFREDVQNNAELQIKVLNGMINYLIEKDGKKWAFLQVIVDGAMSAVTREKRFDRESQKTAVARNKLYAGFSDANFTVAVPEQDLVNDRLLVSRYAKGGSFFKLVPEDQKFVARKLLEMEAKLMFSNKGRVSWYDTDRHAGNYLIDVVIRNGRKHYVITPIDFGQLTYIRHEQRQKVADLFAMAAMLSNMGSNEWITNKIADLLQMNAESRKSLHSNLKDFFPVSDSGKKSVITSYFTLIAAINEASRTSSVKPESADFKNAKLDLVFTDFVRAIIQLNQYEMALGEKALGEVQSPRKILESSVKDQLAKYLQEVQLSRSQELLVKVINFKKWLVWKLGPKQQAAEFINVRMSREQLESFTLDSEAGKTNSNLKNQERISKPNDATTLNAVRCEQVFSI